MATKYDLPQTSEYINNYLRYQELYLKANKTQAEIDEMNSLFNTLSAYLITASDFNNKTEQATFDEHLAETVQNNVHGLKTTGNITIYVDPVNGNDNNSGSQATPLKTINAAISRVTNLVIDYGHTITIQLAPGTYTENVVIKNLQGSGSFHIKGATDLAGANNYIINGCIEVVGCTAAIWLYGIKVLGSNLIEGAVTLARCLSCYIYYCKIDRTGRGHSSENYGILCSANSLAVIYNCDISNIVNASIVAAAIQCFETSRIVSYSNTGNGNFIGLRAVGGTIMKSSTQPTGTTTEVTLAGGVIR